jgi:hypothetical protein
MKLEAITHVKLHFVEESYYEMIHDANIDVTPKHQSTKKPVCFSSRDVAEAYRIMRANGHIRSGYDEYRHMEDENWTIKISITSRNVLKDYIVPIARKMYFFDKDEDKIYEIHENTGQQIR